MKSAKQFRNQIASSFNLSELEALVFDLAVDWDELDGRTKSSKIQSLITHCQRRQQLPQLVNSLREERPKLAWPDAAELVAALTTSTSSDPQQRNRQNILNNIHYTWIEGVLEPALHNDVALALGLSYQHDALNRPQRSLLPEEQPISTEVSLGEIFAARGRALLILGEPASGKTIALLQLLQELLAVAQADVAEPIPIFLNLSSWAQERMALTDWIVEELLVQYQTPRQLSRDWLAGNQLTLLLDGLDEVTADQREACIAAINTFKADHAADMVVCSRLADYEQLQARLNLSTAVRIQPLTPTQIDDYLAGFGEPLADLRQAVAADPDWRELAQSPLMLNLMAYTYSGEANPLPTKAALADKRRQLLATYVERTKQNRPLPPDSPYDEAAALHWLQRIAAQLQAHDQFVFYIEQLQPSWLPNPRPYRWLFGLVLGLIEGLIFGLVVGLILGLIGGLAFGLISGFIFGLVFWLMVGFVFGLKGGMGIRESFRQLFRDSSYVKLVEEVRWQRPSLILWWGKFKDGLYIGLILGSVLGLIVGLIFELVVGLIVWLIIALIVGLSGGVEAFIQTSETRQRTQPNQGIWASWRNAWRTGPVYGLLVGITFGLIGGLLGELFGALFGGLLVGLFIGLIIGLIVGPTYYGGETVIKHYVLRWLLARQGMLPFPFRDRMLVAYLDEMAARLLLRRVGGGWIFVHRTLLEFLADETEAEQLMKDL